MTRREIWDTVYGAAAAAYEPREARAVAALVCEDRLGLRFTDVIVEPTRPVRCATICNASLSRSGRTARPNT